MDGIKAGFKHFIKNKNTITLFAVVVCMGILYAFYNYRINVATKAVSVPYSIQELEPRTLVEPDMVGTVKVPNTMLSGGVLTNMSDIIGKYVTNEAVVPAGSLFYKDLLVNWEQLPSSLIPEIPSGNTIVSLPVTIDTTYGNSIFPGNYIDLYYAVNDKGKLLLGKLIESIKVLAVTDAQGNNIFEKSNDVPAPAYLVFSVDEQYHLLLRKASYLAGTIFPVPRNKKYSENPKNTAVSSAYLETFITLQTVNVADEDIKIELNEIQIEGEEVPVENIGPAIDNSGGAAE